MKSPVLFLLAFCFNSFIQAQTLSQAKNWYLNGEYQKALPVFKNQLQVKPKDASINFWYGVCLFETGKPELSLPYFQVAKAKRVAEADRYLAKYYQNLFVPDTALYYINQYLENPRIDGNKRQSALEMKASIDSIILQLQRVEDICFIDSIVIPKSKLFSTIELSPEAGNYLSAHSVFPEISDSSGSVYFPERYDRAFYAKMFPGKGLDIVARHRIQNEWGEAEPLSEVINTEADECNPYYLSDGVTLYFASNGHGSMGGYDLFVTRLSIFTNTYLLPDHLNMPFNSTANDYFLVIDEFSKRGYLATDRNQPEGFVTIYTFIPSPTKKLLQGKSFKELQSFAQIRSIKATWEGKNMDSLMQQTPVPELFVKETEPELIFLINDSLNYKKESDFKSDEAKRLYKLYCSTYKKYTSQKKILDEKRTQYLQTSPELRTPLISDILKLEALLPKLLNELPSMELRIRNLEISKLSK